MRPWLAQRWLDRRHAPALTHDGTTLSYEELVERVQRRAARLKAMGIGRGSRVGLRAPTSIDWVFAAHATFWLGATLVPLHPSTTEQELAFQLDALPLDVLLVDADSDVSRVDVPLMPLEELSGPAGAECAPANVDVDDIMTVLFTSGTTGTPKAVPLTVQNHMASATASALRLGLCEDDHWLCCLPLCHVGGLAIVLRSAIYGTSFELVEKFEADRILDMLAARPATLASFVPTMVYRLLEATDGPIESTLRAVLVGGGPIDAQLLRQARERGIPALPTYGMTEAGSQLATLSPHEANDDPTGRLLATAGSPLVGVEFRVERDDGSRCAPDEAGALWARGPMLTHGYLGFEEANRERFRDGWFRTGDVGRLDADGYLHIEHRKTDLIVTGGENVDPNEVETVLRRVAAVADTTVVGIDDDEWGQVVAALVVPRHDDTQTDELINELESCCRSQLAAFKVPRRWRLIAQIPRTPSGKVRRNQARRLLTEADAHVPRVE